MSRLAIPVRLARRATVASLAAAALAATPLAAQGSDTTGALPFRRGQWATQFGFDGTLASAGALRFRSNRSAWVVDVFARATRLTYDNPPAIENDDEPTGTDVAVGAQLGMRRYRAVATRANVFSGVGVFGRTFVDRTILPGTAEFYTQRSGAAGVYGELGATWMVTRNFGLSGATQLAASYDWVGLDQPASFGGGARLEGTGYGVQLARTRLMATVYF